MRILVIGGTGFIGKPLVHQLHELGHAVAVFHRSITAADLPSEIIHLTGNRSELTKSHNAIRAFAPDIVIDLIPGSGKQASDLVTAFAEIASRIVAVSSMDVYRAIGVLHGSEPGPAEPLPLTEDSPLRTKTQTYPPDTLKRLQSVFGWIDDSYDKLAVERAIMSAPNISWTILRLPMIYGPGDRLRRFRPLVKRVQDERPAILFAEDVAAWRSPRGYVANVAAAIALAGVSSRAAGRIYNVAEREAFSELEWARKIVGHMGWKGRLMVLPHDETPKHLLVPGNLAQHWIASSDRIRIELGYSEPIPQDEAIRRTIDWEQAMIERDQSSSPSEADVSAFDYAAEDAAITASAL